MGTASDAGELRRSSGSLRSTIDDFRLRRCFRRYLDRHETRNWQGFQTANGLAKNLNVTGLSISDSVKVNWPGYVNVNKAATSARTVGTSNANSKRFITISVPNQTHGRFTAGRERFKTTSIRNSSLSFTVCCWTSLIMFLGKVSTQTSSGGECALKGHRARRPQVKRKTVCQIPSRKPGSVARAGGGFRHWFLKSPIEAFLEMRGADGTPTFSHAPRQAHRPSAKLQKSCH